MIRELVTQRLLLQFLDQSDLDALVTLNADPIIMEFCGGPKPYGFTKERLKQKINCDQEDWMRNIASWDKQMLLDQDVLNGWNGYLYSGLWAKIFKTAWKLIHGADNKFVGECGLNFYMIGGLKEVGIDYRLAKKFWGRGLATEVARELRDYAFVELGVSRLVAVIHSDNLASAKVAMKAGMTKGAMKWVEPSFDVYTIDTTAYLSRTI